MSEKAGGRLTIEDKVFSRRRFVPEMMRKYGFTESEDGFFVSRDLMDGDFTAKIRVGRDRAVHAILMDNMNDEEYVQLRNPNFTGAYVNTVRGAYEKLLTEIGDSCCIDVAFAADQSNRIAELILEEFGVEPDHPWDGEGQDAGAGGYGVFRHKDSGKWFGLIMNVSRNKLENDRGKIQGRISGKRSGKSFDNDNEKDNVDAVVDARTVDVRNADIINLKAEESLVPDLTNEAGIYPAWHMNHRKWISVTLDDTLSDGRVMELIRESFRLTDRKAGVMDEALIREVLSLADSVPAGKVVSYGQIAEMIGRKKNARLIGKIMSMADRYGDHPCHRVVSSAGKTVPGWEEQRGLLEAEGVGFLKNGCVDMEAYRWDGEK